MKIVKEKIKKEKEIIREELKNRTLNYIIAAFGLVAGLAWNEAIRSLIDYFFPKHAGGVLAKFVYAILMTFVIVIISVYFLRIFKKEKK